MGIETYPKKGRSRQSFAGDHHSILQQGSGILSSVKAPSSNDQPANTKGSAWSFGKNKPKGSC